MDELTRNEARSTIPEHQYKVHILPHSDRDPYNLKIWEERDQVSQKLIAIKQ